MTKNINQEVWRLITQDFSVQKDLKRELINVRALAKYLIQEYALDASLDAVISAIRRFDLSQDLPLVRKKVDSILKEISTFTRDDVAIITLDAHKVPKMFSHKDFDKIKTNYRVIKSKQHGKLFVNEEDLAVVLSFFDKKDVVGVAKGLAEIRVVLPPGGEHVSGVLSRVLNEIAIRKVSMNEIIVCYPEFLLYVARDRLLDAHHAVLALHDEAQKSSK